MMRWNRERQLAVSIAVTVVGCLLLAPSVATADDDEQSATDIIERAVERNALGFESGRAQVSLTVFDREGEQRVRKLDVRSRRDDERTRTVMSLTDPAEVRGQAFLFVENPESSDDMWMYVPAFEVTRRVEGEQRRSSFLGTHFTFADLESRDLREADHRRRGDETIGEHDVYVIEATPSEPEKSDYKQVVAYVRQDDYIPLRVRFYDRDGEVEKTLFAEQLDTTGDDVTYVKRASLRAETGGHTTIEITGLDVDVDLPMSLFDRDEFGR